MSNQSIEQKLDRLLRHFKEVDDRLCQIEKRFHLTELAIENIKSRLEQPAVHTPSRKKQLIRWLCTQLCMKFVSLLKWVRDWGVLPLTVLGGIVTVTALRYGISVSATESLNASDPSQTRFIVKNEGLFSLYKVEYDCYYLRIPGVPYRAFHVLNDQPELGPRESFSVRCPIQPPPIPENAILILAVTYRPKYMFGHVDHGGEVFLLKKNKEGHAIWLPNGFFPESKADFDRLLNAPISEPNYDTH